MKRLKLILATAMVACLSLIFAGSAFAAAAGCGQCHGGLVNDNHGGTTVMAGVPATEDLKTPQAGDICNNNGRGLHGIHMNYSSASYGRAAGKTVNGTCNYCHNKHVHENGYVEMSGMTATATQQITSAGHLVVTGTGIGANGLDITLMDGTANCTAACHKGTSATNAAPWGNYTSVSIKLSCFSCHGDASDLRTSATISGGHNQPAVVTGTPSLSSPAHDGTNYDNAKFKGHMAHLNGEWGPVNIVLSANTTVVLETTSNTSCLLCHPDNQNDRYSQGRADDGSKKAYPHAKDGTNVVQTNAVVGGRALSAIVGLGSTNATCTSICHANGAISWDDTNAASHCESCHNHTATSAANNAATVKLSYAHSLHFDQIQSVMGRAASCNDCHVATHANNYAGKVGITQLPVLQGSAGLVSTAGWSIASGTLSVSGTCKNSCHISSSPAWDSISTGVVVGTTGCATCHNYPNSTGIGAGDWTGNNGHMARAKTFQDVTTPVIRKSIKHLNVATAYNVTTDTYANVIGNVRLCGKCHAGATHINGTVNVADSNSLGQCSTTSFTYNNISSNPTNRIVNCSNVSCHFGKTTPNWF